MTTIKEFAQAYEPPQRTEFVNIAELQKISIDGFDLLEDSYSFQNKETKEIETITYQYFLLQNEGIVVSKDVLEKLEDPAKARVRVPYSVIEQLKTMLEEIHDMEAFKVTKKGEGKGTKYFVVPLPK